jgi:methyltransferase (TIGR00027 family)
MQENQSSITAENNAAVRAFEAMRPPHEKICNDTYAHLFLSDRFADSHNISDCLSRTLTNWEIAVPGVCGSVIARTRFIDDCLANAIEYRIEQLVILGAGYDTRALRFSFSIRPGRHLTILTCAGPLPMPGIRKFA